MLSLSREEIIKGRHRWHDEGGGSIDEIRVEGVFYRRRDHAAVTGHKRREVLTGERQFQGSLRITRIVPGGVRRSS